MNKYAKLIEDVEAKYNVRVGFINDTTLSLSSVGYKMMDHMEAEELILKSKLFRYDTSKLQEYDSIAGVTYTHFHIKLSPL